MGNETSESERRSKIYEEIWEKLSKVDVSEHVKNKMGLSYLSWTWAWGTLMEHYPDAEYVFLDEKFYPDGSCAVESIVDIRGCDRKMWLPVMDNRNHAITNPNARQISDARMRCLVKNLAMFGLGHYIYAGEDLPSESTPTPKKKSSAKKGTAKRPPLSIDQVAKPKSNGVEVAKEALDAKEVPGLGMLAKIESLPELRKLFEENKDAYQNLGEKNFDAIRDDFNKRKEEIKKGKSNGATAQA